jgi:hypothetical protein
VLSTLPTCLAKQSHFGDSKQPTEAWPQPTFYFKDVNFLGQVVSILLIAITVTRALDGQ